MIPVKILIDSSGSMNEQAKLAITREVIKTLSMYHLISDLSFSLDIYRWGDDIENCSYNDVTSIICDKKNNFNQLMAWLNTNQDTLVFIISDGNFTKSAIDTLKQNALGLLNKVYIIIVGREDIATLVKSQIFDKRIFLSSSISALITTLEIAHPEIVMRHSMTNPVNTETIMEDDWA